MLAKEIEARYQSDVVKANYDVKGRAFKGLEVFRKYEPNCDIQCAEHDQIWASISTANSERMSDEDVDTVLSYGWMFEEDMGWSKYV